MDSPRQKQGGRIRHLLLCLAVVLVAGVAPTAAFGQQGPPGNDDLAAAEDLGNGTVVTASGSNIWATAEAGEPSHQGITAATNSIWYRWTAPQSGATFLDTCGSNFDTALAVYRGSSVDSLGRVATNDDRCELQSAVRFFAVAGTTYQIAVDGIGGAQGSIELKLRMSSPPVNDDFAAAADIGPGLLETITGNALDATPQPREPNHAGRPAQASVWYRWTAPADRDMQLDTCGSNYDTILAVYTGSELGALETVAGNDDACDVQSTVRFDAVAGTVYSIAIDSFGTQETTPGTTRDIELALQPSNAFHFSRLTRNTRRGTGVLVVRVANPGVLRLAGNRLLAPASARRGAAGRATLPIVPRGRATRLLDARGSARVTARVTFTPDAGRAKTLTKELVLVKRR